MSVRLESFSAISGHENPSMAEAVHGCRNMPPLHRIICTSRRLHGARQAVDMMCTYFLNEFQKCWWVTGMLNMWSVPGWIDENGTEKLKVHEHIPSLVTLQQGNTFSRFATSVLVVTGCDRGERCAFGLCFVSSSACSCLVLICSRACFIYTARVQEKRNISRAMSAVCALVLSPCPVA